MVFVQIINNRNKGYMKKLVYVFALASVFASCQKDLLQPEVEFPIDNSSNSSGFSSGNSSTLRFDKEVERLIVLKTNELRRAVGRDTLVQTVDGDSIAGMHSADMAANNYFSHYDQNGGNPFSRAFDYGLSFSAFGENIAKRGPYSGGALAEDIASAFVTQWSNSAGHYQNMIDSDFEYIGVGFAFDNDSVAYGTQVFYK